MKNFILITCFTLFVSGLYAQGREGLPYDKDKLEAAKIAFITQKLDISPEQATQFWPIYNQFEEKRRKILHQLRDLSREGKENLTDEKATQLIASKFTLQQELLNAEKEYAKKFAEILSPKQSYLLQEADRDFVRHLFRLNRQRGKEDREDRP